MLTTHTAAASRCPPAGGRGRVTAVLGPGCGSLPTEGHGPKGPLVREDGSGWPGDPPRLQPRQLLQEPGLGVAQRADLGSGGPGDSSAGPWVPPAIPAGPGPRRAGPSG